MGKRAEQAKKRKRAHPAPAPAPVAGHDLPTPPAEDLLLPEELESAVDVLRTLAANPALLQGKEMKDLKRGVYDLHRVLAEGAALGTSLTSRISAALRDYRFTDALVLLFEMHARGLPPKLGALQRWVRECDATSNPDGSPGDPEALRCLDMILRIAGDTGPEPREGTSREGGTSRALVKPPRVWKARPNAPGEISLWDRMKAGTLFDAPPSLPYPGFKSVHFVRAHERRPPNRFDSTVWGSDPGAIRLTPAAERPKPTRMDVPGLPGAFLVLDVFTPDECLQIVRAACAHGWERDQPAEGSAAQKNSILARNFVWLADAQVHDHFYDQIKEFVPARAPDEHGRLGMGGKVRGINRRFRTYQYTENQLYRPHIDGAWPAAGLSESGEYLHDSQPADDPLWSRYTLLVYLNGDADIPADSGCTTFFLPSAEVGVMDAFSVKPVQGAVLCFPHGDTHGSLLHEGSAVGTDGGKLVIRTDLLYEAKGYGQFKPPTD